MNKRTAIRERLLAIEPLEERCVLSAFSPTIGYSNPTSASEQHNAIARRVRHILKRSRELLDMIGILVIDQVRSAERIASPPSQGREALRLDPKAVDLAFASFAQDDSIRVSA
jgi:hypothetical protein